MILILRQTYGFFDNNIAENEILFYRRDIDVSDDFDGVSEDFVGVSDDFDSVSEKFGGGEIINDKEEVRSQNGIVEGFFLPFLCLLSWRMEKAEKVWLRTGYIDNVGFDLKVV